MKSEIVMGSRNDDAVNVRDSLKKGIKGLFKKAKHTEQLTPGNLRNSVNLGKSVIDKQLKEVTGQVAWQHKPYCQICYSQFTRISLTPHHCRLCGRTCCKDCSGKRTIDLS